ncbi:IS66 family insertion sequence element accessory protein TnpB [Microbulbifer sp. OS29]|uniref:IS66 family insertion sequence element accessory protein TnpB n=1 Tax=Microbulbifer okhotskensis TaxID=2926617 RepID=A0A9X2ER87_9GAMM|nr:IS66 family insertion sequence element accessory protein TnpB [Microbulbifer okhotskensis]MCO1336964.1 IS66 family insertion sequence element accessory protein TnpB [Microbulbifer okhotskensis]
MNTQNKTDFWQEHISDWNSSDISQTAYCQHHQQKLSTFTYWRNKQSKRLPISLPALQASWELAIPGDIQLPVSALEHTLPLFWRLLRGQH